MKKIIFIIISLTLLVSLKAQEPTISTQVDWSLHRAVFDANFDSLYNVNRPKDYSIILDSEGSAKSITSTFVGFHPVTGDSVFAEGGGAYLNQRQRSLNPLNTLLGNQSVSTGYQTVSAGTNTLTGSNDAMTTGNETMTGYRQYRFNRISLGYDTANYIEIQGDTVLQIAGIEAAIGDQSEQFFTEIDTNGLPVSSQVFWDYPIFWTNVATRDYPAGSPQRIGLVPLRCTAIDYDSITQITKIYYADSIPSLGTSGWISSCKKNSLVGTGHFIGGKYVSTQSGEGTAGFGNQNDIWGATSFGAGGTMNYIAEGANNARTTGYLNVITADGDQGDASGTGNLVSAQNATAKGEYTESVKRGGQTFGKYSKTNNDYDLAFASDRFSEIGDAQGLKFVDNGSSTAAGPFIVSARRIEEYTAYTAQTIVTGVQTSTSPGRPSEAGSWLIKWGFTIDDKYVADSVDISTDRVYYTGDSLRIDDRWAYNAYTDSLENTNGTAIGGLSPDFRLYIFDSGTESGAQWVQLKTLLTGGLRDLTDAQPTQYHVFYRWDELATTTELFGWSFVNDGDDIGNGTTTGIRPEMYERITYHEFRFYLYGLASRTIRWVFNTDMTITKTE